MTSISTITIISAPVDVCFRSSLNIDLELLAAKDYSIKAIGGVTTGIIGAGERVTWQTKQFGIWITHTTEVTGFEPPVYFQDSMVKGLFRSFRHDHFFHSLSPTKTQMRDEMHFTMPVLFAGVVSERLIVKGRLENLLRKRNDAIRNDAEATGCARPTAL
jgi:ligand-binding SRPBCC domain-containing protein